MRNFRVWDYDIYTDGAMKGSISNPGIGFGGWAYIIMKQGKIIKGDHGSAYPTTNQKMELTAIANALEAIDAIKLPDEIATIYSDSAYAINCYHQRWWEKWERNGWENSSHEPVANQDLWKRIIPFFNRRTYNFVKVKGHSGLYCNEVVDKMASDSAESLKNSWKGFQTNE